jgi:hypothetical protein
MRIVAVQRVKQHFRDEIEPFLRLSHLLQMEIGGAPLCRHWSEYSRRPRIDFEFLSVPAECRVSRLLARLSLGGQEL